MRKFRTQLMLERLGKVVKLVKLAVVRCLGTKERADWNPTVVRVARGRIAIAL